MIIKGLIKFKFKDIIKSSCHTTGNTRYSKKIITRAFVYPQKRKNARNYYRKCDNYIVLMFLHIKNKATVY